MNKLIGQWPSFTKEESDAISKTLLSNKVNYWNGKHGKEFEVEFSKKMNVKYSIALANGTLALELALKALKIKKGDEVIVTPRSFIASVSCVVSIGAKPIFADVDRDSGNITARSIEKVISSKTKAIICVHLAGWPCEMDAIMELVKKNKIFVIEDCAQAHGAKYKGKSVGSIGDIGAWSFCQDKIMTTGGEGGMVTTNNREMWESMRSYKDHGKDLNAIEAENKTNSFKWVHNSFGTNSRMTEMQAAIGRIQLKKIDRWSNKRIKNALELKSICDKFPSLLRTPVCDKNVTHAYYKFYTYIIPEGLKEGWTRDSIILEFLKSGIPCFQGSCPEIYIESAFNKTGYRPKNRLKFAKELGETSIMFQVHPTLQKTDIELIKKVMESIFQKASM